jgi:pimeloyl-ACP methyl ester carboxylesterase
MGTYVDLDGLRTWYDELGSGEPLVLLHPGGGGVDSRAFGPNLGALAARFHVFTPERRAGRCIACDKQKRGSGF